MNIRLAHSGDKEKILTLFTQLGKLINKKLHISDIKNENALLYGSENYDTVMQSDLIHIFVIEDKEEIVGAASFFIFTDMISGEKFAHIDDFVIDEPKRSKGYGKALMEGILNWAKQNKIEIVKLTSSLEFEEAHHFYEKIGGKFSQKVIKFDTTSVELKV